MGSGGNLAFDDFGCLPLAVIERASGIDPG